MNAFEEARRIVEEHSDDADFVGPRDELIGPAEQRLGVTFPPSYRQFLSHFGAGSFGAEEFYGLVTADFDNSGVPDAVWMTLEARKDWALPKSMVVVYFGGATDYVVIDTAQTDSRGEATLMSVTPGLSDFASELPVIAADFGAFLLERVVDEVNAE